MRLPKVLLTHPGTQYSFRLALELERQDLLSLFFTGFAFCAGDLFDRVWKRLPTRYRRRLANRRVEGLPSHKLRCHWFGEVSAILAQRSGADPQALLHRRNASFQQAIPEAALAAADAVIGFDTSSWILARRCRQLGIPLIVDQSIAHADSKVALFERIGAQFPGWSEGLESRLPEVRKAEEEEHEGAKLIIAASSFTKRTLIENGVNEEKIRINPYGVDSARFSQISRTSERPFRFVFIGAITARKGVPLLLEAWRELEPRDAELWLIGAVSRKVQSLLPDLRGLRHIGRIPHSEIPGLLQQSDVLVFPSYFEGFGLVILEAMAAGLAVISTTATAAPDLYQHGVEGWIIAPGDLAHLISGMAECLGNPAEVRAKGAAARRIAQRFSWRAYGERWAAILNEITLS
jgi:starch synthase